MRTRRKSLLGIEIHEREVRVVESRLGSVPVILSVASAPIPEGAVQEGRIVRSDVVALAIRRAVESMGGPGQDAVLGVPTAGCITRTLSLPMAPQEELATIVEGEVNHYQILRGDDGAFDFFVLEGAPNEGELSIALMAAEGAVSGSLRETAQRAGLHVVALEPVSIAILRAAQPLFADRATAVVATVTETATELTVTRAGRLALHRRIDVGATALLARPQTLEDAEAEPTAVPMLQTGPAETLLVEVRRTIEFVERQQQNAASVETVILACNCKGLEPVMEALLDGIGVPVVVADLASANTADSSVQGQLSEEGAGRFIAAVGLSRHAPESSPPTIPLLDLFVHERSALAEAGKQRSLTGALLLAIVFILASIGASFVLGKRNGQRIDQIGHLEAQKTQMLKARAESQTAAAKRLNELASLQSSSVPIGAVIDHLGATLDPGTGIDVVSVSPAHELLVEGEATNEASLLATVERMQSRAVFGVVSIVSFQKMDNAAPNTAVRFQLRSQISKEAR